MNLPRGKKTDPKTVEAIKAHYAVSGSLEETAKHFGVSPQTVMKYRDEDPDEFEELRSYNKQRFIEDSWKTLGLLYEAIPHKIPEAPLKEITTSIGIITDKLQLLTGEATSRSENANKNVHQLEDLPIESAQLIVDMFLKGGGGNDPLS